MKRQKVLFLILVGLAVSIAAAGCTPTGPCEITGNQSLTIYRLPDPASDVFGTLPSGETHEVLAYTANGFVGIDPGVAQASITGLARHRWVLLNASLSPFCLAEVPLVTLGDVEHDLFASNLNPPDLVITNVNLPSTQIEENVYAPVEVTVQNQGDGTATDYDVILFPHYGIGPQNPGDQDALPDLAPGASHTLSFSPGVVYSTPGNYTLRVLVTNDWYTSTASTDSIGTNGDFKDIDINVFFGLCNPFAEMEVSLVLLNLPGDTRDLPVYVKVNDDVIPGMDGEPLNKYRAKLGEIASYKCSLQGFPDRLYCMFNIPKGEEGTAKYFELWLNDCKDPVFVQTNVLIPVPLAGDDPGPVCNADLNEDKCTAAGGAFYRPTDKTTYCDCP